MKIIDAKGELCPKPLILTKKALGEIQENESLTVLVDNEASMKNVSRFLSDNGMDAEVKQKGKVYEIIVNKTGEEYRNANVDDYCEIDPILLKNVFVFKSDKIGEGDEKLGKILIQGFIETLPELDALPKALVFLNSGVFMTTSDSKVLDSLKSLNNKGTEILVCGTCLDYYQIMDQLQVGKVSNMYDILNWTNGEEKVIYAT